MLLRRHPEEIFFQGKEMKIWSDSEGSCFLPGVHDWVSLWRNVLGAALQRMVFCYFLKQNISRATEEGAGIWTTPLCKNHSRTWLFLPSCTCFDVCVDLVWQWQCSASLWVTSLGFAFGFLSWGTWTWLAWNTNTLEVFQCWSVWHSSPAVLFGMWRHVHPQQSCGYMDIGLGQFPFPDCLDTAVCRAVECRGSGNSPVKSVFSLLSLFSPLTPWAAALFQVPEVMVFELFNSISKTNGYACTPQHFCGLLCVHI